MADDQPRQLSLLRTWARFNSISIKGVEIAPVSGRGNGLVATEELTTITAEGSPEGQHSEEVDLLTIPRGLVLNAEAVEQRAKEDGDFKSLLDAAGGLSTRGDIMLFLLAMYSNGADHRGGPWQDYLRFLPQEMSVPTLWTRDEQVWLNGTSIEVCPWCARGGYGTAALLLGVHPCITYASKKQLADFP